MAKGIVVNLGGEVSDLGLTRVQREKLYGRKMRVMVDERGEDCVAALLTRDGTALLPPGSVAHLYVDPAGDVVDRAALGAVDGEGRPVAPVESTLGVEQALQGPVDPEEILDHNVTAVYELDAAAVGPRLGAALDGGAIFRTRFAYRSGFESAGAFLLRNDEGTFLLVGEPVEFDYIGKEAPAGVVEETAEDDLDDDLDFGML